MPAAGAGSRSAPLLPLATRGDGAALPFATLAPDLAARAPDAAARYARTQGYFPTARLAWQLLRRARGSRQPSTATSTANLRQGVLPCHRFIISCSPPRSSPPPPPVAAKPPAPPRTWET